MFLRSFAHLSFSKLLYLALIVVLESGGHACGLVVIMSFIKSDGMNNMAYN